MGPGYGLCPFRDDALIELRRFRDDALIELCRFRDDALIELCRFRDDVFFSRHSGRDGVAIRNPEPGTTRIEQISYAQIREMPLPQTVGHHQYVRMAKEPCVYIMTNQRSGTLYVGVTANLIQRAYLHRVGCFEGFTQRYSCKRLVYFEWHESMPGAIRREKQLKHWRRKWKLDLIESFNPEWRDLYPEIVG